MIQHKFSFKNIGIVKEAEIELNGLTVLTGLNDTGKSFLSKAIFSIIKSINTAQYFMGIDRYKTATNGLNTINSFHRQYIPFTTDKQREFNTNILNQRFSNIFVNKQTKPTEDADVIKEVKDYTDRVIKDLESIKPQLKNYIKQIDGSISNINVAAKGIIQLIDKQRNSSLEDDLKSYFDRNIIQKLFQSQLNTIQSDHLLKIVLEQGVSTILTIEVENNSTREFKVPIPLYLKDATLIETPTIIQLTDFITNTLAYSVGGNERGDLPIHFQDLSGKLKIPSPPNYKNAEDFSEILNDIKNLIGGELKVKADENTIVFEKKSGAIIRSNNIATGIKSFGILQLLINSPHVNQNSLLILDEPEVHLHPLWEIEYARIIVKLVKKGMIIVLSSHSAYFIQALSKYSEIERIDEATKFYFADKKDGISSIFDDVTNDLTPIFAALAKPMKNLSNL